MKPRFTLKFLLKATIACVLLTLVWLVFESMKPIRIDYFREFELIAVWIILLLGWAVYFLDLYRARRNQNENDEKTG